MVGDRQVDDVPFERWIIAQVAVSARRTPARFLGDLIERLQEMHTQKSSRFGEEVSRLCAKVEVGTVYGLESRSTE